MGLGGRLTPEHSSPEIAAVRKYALSRAEGAIGSHFFLAVVLHSPTRWRMRKGTT